MSDYADTFHEHVEHQRQRRRHLFFKIDGDLLFSAAINEIASSGATVTVLLHIIARQTLPPRLKDRKRLEKAGIKLKAEPFSFPVREARHHGISERALAAGLRRLHHVGIIDRIHPGSAAKRGDYAIYVMSNRWRKWGQRDFVAKEWKAATPIGVNDTGRTGKFLCQRIGKTVQGKFVAAKLTAINPRSVVKVTATQGNVAAKVTVNQPYDDQNVAATSTVLVPYTGGPEGIERKDVDPQEVCQDHGRGGGDSNPTIFTEALFHLPDDKRQFVIDLHEQVAAGTLPPRHARTKLVMPRIVSAEVAKMLFPDPPKGERP